MVGASKLFRQQLGERPVLKGHVFLSVGACACKTRAEHLTLWTLDEVVPWPPLVTFAVGESTLPVDS